jgi:hypothetical protein
VPLFNQELQIEAMSVQKYEHFDVMGTRPHGTSMRHVILDNSPIEDEHTYQRKSGYHKEFQKHLFGCQFSGYLAQVRRFENVRYQKASVKRNHLNCV